MNRLGKPINVLTVLAIATTGMSTPAVASPDITSDRPGDLKLAQLVGQCRAAKQQIPVFRSADPTSEALRLISTEGQVTLASNAVDANGFISISAPVSGFVHAINLKNCNSSGGTPPTKDLCRRVIRPSEGLIIRRDPTSTSAQVGGVSYLERVSLTTAPPTVKRAENRDWIEISAPARGWVSNGLVTDAGSNLAYCP